jgi:hypothetical protein
VCFETLKTLPKKARALRENELFEIFASSTTVRRPRWTDSGDRGECARRTRPGGRSGVPAGCWEHTESGTPCFALRRRRARRRTRRPPAGHGLYICTADRTSAAARLSRRDRSTTLNRTYLSPDNRTVHSSHSFSRQYLSVRIVLRVSGGRTSVFHARKLSIFQVSRVTKGRSRRSSQNENRTNEHHLIIYK